jgi:hypothetical protein
MRILFNDQIQNSNAPKELKSPMLTDYYVIKNNINITLFGNVIIDSIGIGNTNGTYLNIIINNESIPINFKDNGLYYLNKRFITDKILIQTNATHIGRLGAGIGIYIPTSIAKEPAFNSTNKPRYTLSGQTIAGVGGYNYKTLSLDSRYKINDEAFLELLAGYKYIGMGYPFFINLTDEAYKLPFKKLYAIESNQMKMSFEGGIKKFLYSKKFYFEEKF